MNDSLCGSATEAMQAITQSFKLSRELSHVAAVACLAGLCAVGHHSAAAQEDEEDTVVVATGADGSGRSRRTGQVLDYTGGGLLLRERLGREVKIAADKVIEVITPTSPAHRAGDTALATADYAQAVNHYETAIRNGAERRAWVRRQILASVIVCKQALGQYDTAGQYFVGLVQNDPQTPHFHVIPLAWTPGAQVDERRAAAWLADAAPAARLLGASYLLPMARRNLAKDTLEKLLEDADRRVVLLATFQLRRLQTATVDRNDLPKWQNTIDQLPEPFRAGPYYVLGRGLAAQDQHRRAAVALMHVPILYPQRPALAAEALLAAGRSLAHINQPADAARIYQELISDHPAATAAAEARQRLETLTEAP